MKTNRLMLCVGFLVLAVAAASAADAPKLTFKFAKANVPGALQTFPGASNNAGVTTGQYEDSSGGYHGYILKGKKNLTTLDDPKGTNTGGSGINSANNVVGSYTNSSGNSVGFLYTSKSGTFTDIAGPAGATSSVANDINDKGWVVGWYTDSSGVYHGFLLQGSKYTTLDVPTASISFADGINNRGDIAMGWRNSSNFLEGSLYKIERKTYKTINVPHTTGSNPTCTNDKGDIVFLWYDSINLEHGALRHGGKYYKFDYPKAIQTFPACVNDKNAIVGYYQTSSNGPWSGYKATYNNQHRPVD
jgi:probable HAF family extracellular repeat protein